MVPELSREKRRQQAFDEIDGAVWFEGCDYVSDAEHRSISMATLRTVFYELALLRDVRIEIDECIAAARRKGLPEVMDLTDVAELLANGVESDG
jgi:hypothetical protein